MKEKIEYIRKCIEGFSAYDSEKTKELLLYIEELTVDINREAEEKELALQRLSDVENKCSFYESAVDALPNPIFSKNEKGEFIHFNVAYQEYFNIDREKYLHKSVLDLDYLPLGERIKYHEDDLKLIKSGKFHHYEKEFLMENGETHHTLYWSKGFKVEKNNEKGLVGEIVDISLQKKLQNEISQCAIQLEAANKTIEDKMIRDPLTGLYNRRIIDANSTRIRAMLNEEQASISLILADLDNFKMVNDTFGHAVGDEILITFASILNSCSRSDDLVVRLGGEEFLVVLFHTNIEQGQKIAERICNTTRDSLILPNGKANTVSLGVAEISPSEEFVRAVSRADRALYSAKSSGKNRVVLKYSRN